MTAALIALGVVYLTFVHYSAVMNLARVRNAGKLTTAQKPLAYLTLWVGLLLDVTLNVLVSLCVLFALPRNLLLTGTLIRYKRAGPHGGRLARWRCWVANAVCRELLDSLDPHPSGCHCRVD